MKTLRFTATEKRVLDEVSPMFTRYIEEAGPAAAQKIAALEKVTRLLSTERRALQELAAVGLLRQGVESLAGARAQLELYEEKVKAITYDNTKLRKQLQQTTAIPALAQYAE